MKAMTEFCAMVNGRRWRTPALLALWVAAASCARAGNLAVTATLEPQEIALGQGAQLSVTCSGGNGAPRIAPVDGLSFQHVGQSSRFQFINGAMSSSVTHTYVVSPDRTGTYTIPPVIVTDGRETAQSQPLVLRVGGGPPVASQQHPAPGFPQAQPAPSTEPKVDPSEAKGIGFLRLVLPRTKLYVGETVPARIEAVFREGVGVRVGAPKFGSDAFTMTKVGDEPEQRRALVNGVPCTVLTWSTYLAAVKDGDHAMTVELPATITMRVQGQRQQSRARGFFSDPFFDDFFGDSLFGRTVQKSLPLNSEPIQVSVAPLPAEGRPRDFSGAVGKFEIAAEAAPSSVAAGDPVTLKVRISGEGNFDRVSTPGVERDGTWKSYQPSAGFEAGDGLSGTKTFEQALVPLRGGRIEIPAVAFSYFDPEKGAYVTRATPPIPVDVAPGAPPPPAAVAAGTAAPPQVGAPATPTDGILPDKVELGHFFGSLEPWFLRPDRLALGLSPSLAAALAWLILGWARRRNETPGRSIEVETRRFIRGQMALMREAARRGAAEAFFSAARDALRQRLAVRWGVPAQAITLAEVDARGDGGGEGCRQIFELADEVVFAGGTYAPEQLDAWLAVVEEELVKLEAK